jgi:acyl CoA:acetate/3-ketoacid CoA transferase alpha subunit/acyl CoA:acetate/3-ketoacid CoA transferase beta subunit
MTRLEDSEKISALLEQFRIPINEGKDKTLSLEESVRRYVRPGMSLHFAFVHSRAYGAAYEIARQFWGKRPGFELIVAGVLEFGMILLYGGLVKKVVAAFYGDTYPSPSPNRIIKDAFRSGQVEFESWTNLTLPLRLMAGALNLPFIPTNSIAHSSLAEGKENLFRMIPNPFDGGSEAGIMKPLNPDLAIVHAWAADRYGNAITLAPHGEDLWGALASRNGVLLTVEKLVSTEFIREHSHLVKLPGYLVNSVSLVPFGAHPQPMTNRGLREFSGYGEDYKFRLDFKEASRDDALFEKWIKDWVLQCPSHKDYLKKLGSERLLYLKGKSSEDAWQYEFDRDLEGISLESAITPTERMILTAAREIKKTVIAKSYKTILAGAGIASLAAWVAFYDLRKDGVDVELIAEAGFFGFCPRPGDPYVFNFGNMPTNKMQSGFINILGVVCGGNNSRCLGVIGAGQIDCQGNINSTQLSEKAFLVGSGGANDIGMSAKEVVVLVEQTRERFVARLPYLTTPGGRVTKVFSTMGVYEKLDPERELVLTGLLTDDEAFERESNVETVKSKCGWPLKIKAPLSRIARPSEEELLTLRLFDPARLMI